MELKIAKSDGVSAVEVVDQGPGICDEAMPFIYDRFFRSAPPEIEGTGLASPSREPCETESLSRIVTTTTDLA